MGLCSDGPCEFIGQIAVRSFSQMERGRIQGLPKFFEYPLLSQERIKLRTSTFVRTFLVSIVTKVRYKFVEK